jgi:hypothetical protein
MPAAALTASPATAYLIYFVMTPAKQALHANFWRCVQIQFTGREGLDMLLRGISRDALWRFNLE